ncbi:ankyrin repeat domain-containing protein [Candidatus Micrarchaeota archaeon]|nr:ankyrin repeat domain-containing protein [Candidatus Micrarchaeota archaeon]
MVDWNKELINASGDGNLERMEEAIRNGADVNFKDKIGKTPLFYATLFVRKKAVDLLLEKGADIDFEIGYGKNMLTVFLWAVQNNYRSMVGFLLDRGADFAAMDRNNLTALEYTLNNKEDNKVDVLKALMKHAELNVNRKGRDGKTLMMHVMEGNVKDEKEKKTKINVVRMLIRKGADVDGFDREPATNLIYAIKGGHIEIAKILIRNGAEVDVKDANGKTALVLAAEGEYEKIVELLIQKRVDINVVLNNLKEKVLMWAAGKGYRKIVELAIEKGICVKLKNIFGRTALMLAAEKGHTEIAERLINEGACVNRKNNKEETALVLASLNGHTKTAELLIQHGADINARDDGGFTPLMWAALNKCTETVELLIKKGADVNARDWKEQSALVYAGRYNYIEIIKLLIEKGTDVANALGYASEKGNIVIRDNIAKVLRENPNLNKIEYKILYEDFGEIEKYGKGELLTALRKLTKEKAIGKEKALEIFRGVKRNRNNEMGELQRIKMRLPRNESNGERMRRMDREI